MPQHLKRAAQPASESLHSQVEVHKSLFHNAICLCYNWTPTDHMIHVTMTIDYQQKSYTAIAVWLCDGLPTCLIIRNLSDIAAP